VEHDARYIRPRLKAVGLGWVDYRVMRWTHSSPSNEKNIDPKLVADQQGHGVDVNLNVYTQMSFANRLEAVEIPCARPVACCMLHNIPAMTFRHDDAGQSAPLFQLLTSP